MQAHIKVRARTESKPSTIEIGCDPRTVTPISSIPEPSCVEVEGGLSVSSAVKISYSSVLSFDKRSLAAIAP